MLPSLPETLSAEEMDKQIQAAKMQVYQMKELTKLATNESETQPAANYPEKTLSSEEDDTIPTSWLVDRANLEQIDAELSEGRLADNWAQLRIQIQLNDQVWSFCSPPESWDHHAGQMGFAVVRDGNVIAYLAIIRN